MNFDIQRFADVTINPGQTYVTATSVDKTYTITTTSAAPQIEMSEDLSEELRTIIESGEATGTVSMDDGTSVEVTIATDGAVSVSDDSVDPGSLIGKTVSINGSASAQTATLVPATTVTGTTDGVAASGTVTLRADATYTTYYVVAFGEGGAVQSAVTISRESCQIKDR